MGLEFDFGLEFVLGYLIKYFLPKNHPFRIEFLVVYIFVVLKFEISIIEL